MAHTSGNVAEGKYTYHRAYGNRSPSQMVARQDMETMIRVYPDSRRDIAESVLIAVLTAVAGTVAALVTDCFLNSIKEKDKAKNTTRSKRKKARKSD